MMLFREITV
ncbi:hypothetical protein BDFB_014307 [Asbolus verrucosus]|uniref:Uncharacterized protein n=1 Tax=Asbolus verrucosus TaxID=1661398 RepID=A0A482VA51_ASBVE|nr:hypothetical protein BDFB_014307 [Asbolus verrucosus]